MSARATVMKRIHRRIHPKADGRLLYLYGWEPHTLPPLEEDLQAPMAASHLRWHPLREEWVVYAAHRQERTFLPPPEVCPFCPSHPGGVPTEIPFEDFEVAVFENRFPALQQQAPSPPALPSPLETAPARGACEIVVYTPEHTGSLATLSQKQRELLVRVWIDRYEELFSQEGIQFVMPFENRGEAVGVTLHHPHGQIYAYPFVPPILQREVQAFQRRPVLQELLEQLDPEYTVLEDKHSRIQAFVPPFARYPYEIWVAPQARHPGPWTFNNDEVRAFAWILGGVVASYNALFQKPFPYVMVLHAAPKGEKEGFHFHVEIYPPLRAANKLKYLAGTELGAETFVVDALPEESARTLREVAQRAWR